MGSVVDIILTLHFVYPFLTSYSAGGYYYLSDEALKHNNQSLMKVETFFNVKGFFLLFFGTFVVLY